MLIVDLPLSGANILLEAAKAIDPETKILLLVQAGTGLSEVRTADVAIWPENCTVSILLDQVKMLAVRHRGPKAIRKPVVAAGLFGQAIKKLD